MISFKSVKLLIIDMDNTLCDTFHTLSRPQWEKVRAAFEKRGQKEYAQALRKNFGKHGFVHTLKEIGMSANDQKFAVKVYDDVSVKSLKLYPDAYALLAVDIPKVLVTRGEKKLQIRKIEHLKIRKHFAGIYYIGTFNTKKAGFQKIMKQFKVKPKDCLVIGDRIEEEIKVANTLGIPSVLVRRPDWKVHKGMATPDLTVRSLKSIAKRIQVMR